MVPVLLRTKRPLAPILCISYHILSHTMHTNRKVHIMCHTRWVHELHALKVIHSATHFFNCSVLHLNHTLLMHNLLSKHDDFDANELDEKNMRRR